jgi:DMSO/TMAO reductase YedYZ molybdopterin-dependent catalytic subunit
VRPPRPRTSALTKRDQPLKSTSTGARGGRGIAAGCVLGILTAGVALAVGEAVAVLTGPATAPVFAVGEAAVNLTPAPLKEYAVAHFGERDKEFLVAGIVAILAVIALAAGLAALRRFAIGAALVALFGAIGAIAAASQPDDGWTSVLPSAAGAAAGIWVLRWLAAVHRRGHPSPAMAEGVARVPRTSQDTTMPETPVGSAAAGRDTDRRGFVLAATGIALGSATVGFGANLIGSKRYNVSGARAAVRIPKPTFPAPALPAALHPNVAGLSPFFTDNAGFYRVDTALVLPQVNPNAWTLRIHGMVDRPIELSFADLLQQPLYEHDLTLSCVSDPVGGPYVGTARWIGASLPALLRSAGVQSGADQLIARSVDGMTIGTPIGSILDGRRALLAVAMNGEALPIAHGFPARMLVPGFYGYSSACKWVTELDVTTYAAQEAYWVRRGYARIGTMKTQSRIDVPSPFARLKSGPVTVAGVAWATDRGISAVQVQVDQGPWNQATPAAQDGPDTWRQWTYEWQASPGTHTLQVRAADDSGRYQTGVRTDPYPAGASGWESVFVTVS